MDLTSQSNDISDALLTKRQILLQGSVDGNMQTKITRLIFHLNAINSLPITLIIDTGGGKTELGMCICDAIRYSQANVIGMVVADAQSAGFDILQACDKRLAYPGARLMFHAPAGDGKRIDADDWDRYLLEARENHEECLKVYAKRSGQSIKSCRQWAKEEKRFFAPEALRLGFIDAIVKPPKK